MIKRKPERVPEKAEVKPPPPQRVPALGKVNKEVLVDRTTPIEEDTEAEYAEITTRHEARRVALQMSYHMAITGKTLTQVWAGAGLTGAERHIDFLRRLLMKTNDNVPQLDEQIERHVEKWSLERLALTDHLLLRIALCELIFVEETPPKVVLNEAIELAKEFSTHQSGRFINGILDAALSERTPPKVDE